MTDSEQPGPTRRQDMILRVIEEYAAVHGCSPSNREIAVAAGISDDGQISRLLKRLEQRTLIEAVIPPSGSRRTSRKCCTTTPCWPGPMRTCGGGPARLSPAR